MPFMCSYVKEGSRALGVSFYKGMNPVHQDTALLSQPPPASSIRTLATKFQPKHLDGTQTFTVTIYETGNKLKNSSVTTKPQTKHKCPMHVGYLGLLKFQFLNASILCS